MGGVYGDLMVSFPELFKTYTWFTQDPLPNGGYTNRSVETNFRGAVQNLESGAKDLNGNLVKYSKKALWTRSNFLAGTYIRVVGVVYNVIVDNDWPNEAGYYSYTLEKVIGLNGDAVSDPAWNLGGGLLG